MNTIPLISSSLRKIRKAWYEFRCFLKPFNVLKIQSLPRTWVDRDETMYHAVFQILVDFVELEQPFVDWEEKKRGRFTDRTKMRSYIEKYYPPEKCRPEYYNDMSDAEKKREDEQNEYHYKKNLETLDLYEWYKDGKYEFEMMKYYEMTGEKHEIINSKIERVPTGKPKLITWEEYHKLEDDHNKLRDAMLQRVIAIRGYLWT